MLLLLGVGSSTGTQSGGLPSIRHVGVTGDDPVAIELLDALRKKRGATGAPSDAMCACALDARTMAESEGRIDFSVVVETSGDGEPIDLTMHVRMGSPYRVGRILFTGLGTINDSTLRRAFTLREHDVFDVGKLRRSLARLNGIGLTDPVTLADIVVTRHADDVTADITIPLRQRNRRWWSLSGPIVPGLGTYHASISSRLPMWGRGAFDVSTYLLTFNLFGLIRSSRVLTLMTKAPPAAVLLERPSLPGQEWLSGFAVSPSLAVRPTVAYYGRTQLGRLVGAVLEDQQTGPMVVPLVGIGRPAGEFIVCEPAKARWRWLRSGALHAIDIALAAALP